MSEILFFSKFNFILDVMQMQQTKTWMGPIQLISISHWKDALAFVNPIRLLLQAFNRGIYYEPNSNNMTCSDLKILNIQDKMLLWKQLWNLWNIDELQYFMRRQCESNLRRCFSKQCLFNILYK